MQSKRHILLPLLVLVLALFVLPSPPAHGQEVYSRVRGTVTDASGAAVSGATIKATNTATGIDYTTTSNSAGAYEFLQLPIGPYTITATQQGFETYTASGITLTVGQIYVQNITLKVGAVSATVNVEGNPAQVEMTSMQRGDTILSKQIVDLPLNGRNWLELHALAPGVVASSDRFGTFATNGNETQQNSYLINGADNNDVLLNNAWFTPSPDAIAEFQLVTSTINPEYGRNSGGVINFVTKSGTSQFHGTAHWDHRHEEFNANSFFNNRSGIARPLYRYMIGGYSFGGPAYIPKAFNRKKEKLFFFISQEFTQIKVPTTVSTANEPTALERAGDFSDLRNSLGALIPVIDPLTLTNRSPGRFDGPAVGAPPKSLHAMLSVGVR